MTLITIPGSGVGGEGRRAAALSVSETYWGYEIGDRSDRFERDGLAENFLKFLGLIFVIAAYGQWFLPELLFRGEAMVVKATICFLLGAAGCWLYWTASRGFALSAEIDLARREIRVVRRNGRRQRRVEATVPMSRVESAFVQRSKVRGQPAHLCLRMRAPESILHLATGPERELETLFRRLSHDLRPLKDRIDDRLAHSVTFRTRRTR